MKLIIKNQIFSSHPELTLGVLMVSGMDNHGNSTQLSDQLRKAEDQALEIMGEIPIIEHPHIAPWREAYRQFGAKPKKYRSSIENLIRRISKGEEVRHINKLVDIYNIVSLKHVVPVGGEDLDKMQGDILLTTASKDELPIKLLGESEARPPYENEVIYKDDIGTICRRWNWKEVDRTKLTENTQNAIIVIEGLSSVGKPIISEAIKELEELIKIHCGGEIKTHLLDKNNTEIEL